MGTRKTRRRRRRAERGDERGDPVAERLLQGVLIVVIGGAIILAGTLIALRRASPPTVEVVAERSHPPEPAPEPEPPLLFADDPAADEPETDEPWRAKYRAIHARVARGEPAEAVADLEALLPDVGSEAGRTEVEGLLRYCCQVGADEARERGDASTEEELLGRGIELPFASEGAEATARLRLASLAYYREALELAAERILAVIDVEAGRRAAIALGEEIAAELALAEREDEARLLLERIRASGGAASSPAVVIAGAYARRGRLAEARAVLDGGVEGDDAAELREWIDAMEVALAASRDSAASTAAVEAVAVPWERAARFDTARFFRVRSNLPEWVARWAAGRFETAFNELLVRFEVPPPARRLDLLLFRDRRDYVGFCERDGHAKMKGSNGFFAAEDRLIAYRARPSLDRESLLEGLTHEAVHYAVHLALGRTERPRWLGEGIADYLAASIQHGAADAIGDPARCSGSRFTVLAARENRGERRPLAELVRGVHADFIGDDAAAWYAGSLSLVRFLIEADDGARGGLPALVPTQSGLRRFLHDVPTERLDAPEVEAAWRQFERDVLFEERPDGKLRAQPWAP